MDQKQQKLKTNTKKFAQSQNIPQPILNLVNFLDQPRFSQEQNGKYPFFQQREKIQINIILQINLIITHKIIFHQTMENIIIKLFNNFFQTQDLVLTAVLINQIFSNHTHEINR